VAAPSGTVDAYLREREALLARATPGLAAARELSDLTDRAVSALAETALSPLRKPWAVLALGGYGGRRLHPGSDLDLLVATDAPADELSRALKGVLYPLWDAGLAIGHQVRSRRDHLRATRADLDTLTATLAGRVLCGDLALGGRLLAEVADDARKRSRAVLRDIWARPRPGSPYLLEPDLKEGAGGQRDLDALGWVAAVLEGQPVAAGPGSAPLETRGLLTADEARLLQAAAEAIAAGRWSLHLAQRRPTSVLSPDLALDLALDLEALQGALADVHHVFLRAQRRASVASAAGPRAVARGAGAAHAGTPDPAPSAGSATARAVLDACSKPDAAGLSWLEEAAWSGALEDLLPGMRALMTARRPGLSHRYTVGDHSLRCATGALAPDAEDPMTTRALAALPDPRVLLVAALVHDAGKIVAGAGHPERGAGPAHEAAARFGLDDGAARDVELLVREHLLLVETAATQDLHDEDVVLRIAAKVPRDGLLAALYLLTKADSIATGPGTWSPWHAALVGELADRLTAALSTSVAGAGIAGQADSVREQALRALAAGPEGSTPGPRDFIALAPLRYLASRTPDEVVADAHLVTDLGSHASAVAADMSVTTGAADGTWRVTIAAVDRPGLFATLAGVCALAGLDILAADAYPAPDGVALDVFTVHSATLATVGPETWTRFERYLNAGLSSRLALESRLAEKRRHYAAVRDDAVRVEIGASNAYATAVTVVAPDRIGLLHDLALAMTAGGLDIRWAKATTRDGIVRDVFHVTDAAGEPVTDPGELGHLVMRIRERAQARL
jgi:[protein-PII] uridylyltransferase